MNQTDYSLIRSRRKTVSLEINREAELVVRAPNRMSMRYIEEIVLEKDGWIKKKREQMMKKRSERKPLEFTHGESFLFLGESFPLEIRDQSPAPLTFDEKFVLHGRYRRNAKEVFQRWYKDMAKILLTDKTHSYAKQAGLTVNSVKITSAKKRWGSCNSKGNIHYSWRLILAPPHVVDYVVAHEVAHLKEMNHSRAFWSLVQCLYPKYKESKKWLKDHGHTLDVE